MNNFDEDQDSVLGDMIPASDDSELDGLDDFEFGDDEVDIDDSFIDEGN